MTVSIHEPPKRTYVNVMELLVAEEVERQLKPLPPRVLKYVKRVEVETYALNRLPSLYASSERGWQHQYEKARREMRSQIKNAVQQALAAVQVDPLRQSQPLRLQNNAEEAQVALQTFRELLSQPELTWEGVIKRIRLMASRQSLNGQSGASSTGQVPPSASSPPPPPPPPPPSHDPASHRHHWRPGTYGSEVAWHPKNPPKNGKREFGWDDARYFK